MIKQALSISILGVFLTGCGVGTTQLTPIQLTPTQLNNKKPIKLTFKNSLKNLKIDDSKIAWSISKELPKFSKYSFERSFGSLLKIKGFSSSASASGYITAKYENTEDYGSSIGRTMTLYDINYNIKEIEGGKQIEIHYPIKKFTTIGTNGVNGTIPPLDTSANIQQDFDRIFSRISSTNFIIQDKYPIKGEFNSKYSSTSIYANFERIFGSYKSDATKKIYKDTYKLDLNNKITPIYVKVYPYRNGSKVQYSVDLPYTLNSNGNMSISEKNIEEIKRKIEKTVND